MGNLIQPNINNNPCRPGFHRSGGRCVQNVSPSRSQHFGDWLGELHRSQNFGDLEDPQGVRRGSLLRADATNVEDPQGVRRGSLLRADATNVEDPQYKGGGKIKK
jgi:hypothetical protein